MHLNMQSASAQADTQQVTRGRFPVGAWGRTKDHDQNSPDGGLVMDLVQNEALQDYGTHQREAAQCDEHGDVQASGACQAFAAITRNDRVSSGGQTPDLSTHLT